MELRDSMETPTLPPDVLPGGFDSMDQDATHQSAEVEGVAEQSQSGLTEEGVKSNKFEFTWQDLPSVVKYIDRHAWHRDSSPEVLQHLPENLVLGDKLRQILDWSLQRSKPVIELVPPVVAAEPPETALPDDTDDADSIQEEPTSLPVTPSASDALNRRSTSIKVHMREKDNLFARLKRLRQNVAMKRVASVRHKEKMIANNIPPPADEPPQMGECISCFEELPKADLLHLECYHDYCKTCLHEVVINTMKNESAFPPKCCLSEISRKQILSCLSPEERDEYKDKAAEYSIPAGHRWYCPEPSCGKWIKPENLHRDRRTHQVCPHCSVNICSICRSVAHPENEDCPQDFGLEATLEIADSEGWRRCYSCRNMVELTTGCRHITCRCGAEFCYVCNARWRTCECTEADKERRLAELRGQREQRTREQEEADAAAEAEAEEVAEAIRQVEQMELEELARREEQERQRQLEEELALAKLEEERLLEEIARREAELELEQQLRETLVVSSKEECQTMMSILMQIVNFQHTALMSEHESNLSKVVEKKEKDQERHSSKIAKHTRWLEENIKKRKQVVAERHIQEQETLQSQAEEEDDDMFMQMQIYLKDKPNREAREKKMRDALQKKQAEQTAELTKRHEEERQRLDSDAFYEREGLRRAAGAKLDPIIKEFQASLKVLGRQIGHDREWFQHVSSRRIKMMLEHKKIMLRQIEAQEDAVGLTEEGSASIEPIIPAADADEDTLSDSGQPLSLIVPPRIDQTEDMYASSGDGTPWPMMQPRSTAAENATTLARSDTVVRAIPGAYPPSRAETNTNRNRMPTFRTPQPQPFHRATEQSQRLRPETISTNGVIKPGPVPVISPSIKGPPHHQRDNFQDHRQSLQVPNTSNPWQTPLQTFPVNNRDSQHLDPVSPTHHENRNSGTESTRTSTAFSHSSISPISSKHSSVITDSEILDTMAANIVANSDRQARRSLFGGRFSRRSQISEEEIKQKMASSVGTAL